METFRDPNRNCGYFRPRKCAFRPMRQTTLSLMPNWSKQPCQFRGLLTVLMAVWWADRERKHPTATAKSRDTSGSSLNYRIWQIFRSDLKNKNFKITSLLHSIKCSVRRTKPDLRTMTHILGQTKLSMHLRARNSPLRKCLQKKILKASKMTEKIIS